MPTFLGLTGTEATHSLVGLAVCGFFNFYFFYCNLAS